MGATAKKENILLDIGFVVLLTHLNVSLSTVQNHF